MFSPSARILVLDSSEEARKHVSSQLNDIGFRQVTTAADDKEGWNLLSNGKDGKNAFHVLVCDWETAYGKAALLARLRAHQSLRSMAVLVMLPNGTTKAPQHDEKLTVQGILHKPTRLADLVRSLKHTDSEKTAA